MRTIPLAVLTLLVLLPSGAGAEYKRIELKIFGMDCAICAHGVRVAFHKVDGVESATLSLERAEADIRLRPDNRVSVNQLRRIVKANGFEPRDRRQSPRSGLSATPAASWRSKCPACRRRCSS